MRTDLRHGAANRSASELKAVIEAERAGVPFLVWRDAEGAQQILVLTAAAGVAIGRSESNDVVLSDREASRAHAELRRVGVEWTIEEVGPSRNGTFVNEVRVTQRRRLSDGDVMRFGQARVEFRRPRGGSTAITLPGLQNALTSNLTESQRRVLVALCRPCRQDGAFAVPASNNQIAEELFLGIDAVKKHLGALYQRFGLDDLPQNVKRARLAERALLLGLGRDAEPS